MSYEPFQVANGEAIVSGNGRVAERGQIIEWIVSTSVMLIQHLLCPSSSRGSNLALYTASLKPLRPRVKHAF